MAIVQGADSDSYNKHCHPAHGNLTKALQVLQVSITTGAAQQNTMSNDLDFSQGWFFIVGFLKAIRDRSVTISLSALFGLGLFGLSPLMLDIWNNFPLLLQ